MGYIPKWLEWAAARSACETDQFQLLRLLQPFTSPGENCMSEESPPAVFVYGRLVFWLILALMVVSVIYAGWQALANWTSITV